MPPLPPPFDAGAPRPPGRAPPARPPPEVEEAAWRDLEPNILPAPLLGGEPLDLFGHARHDEQPPHRALRRWWWLLGALVVAAVVAVALRFMPWDEPACGGRLYVPSAQGDAADCVDPEVLSR